MQHATAHAWLSSSCSSSSSHTHPIAVRQVASGRPSHILQLSSQTHCLQVDGWGLGLAQTCMDATCTCMGPDRSCHLHAKNQPQAAPFNPNSGACMLDPKMDQMPGCTCKHPLHQYTICISVHIQHTHNQPNHIRGQTHPAHQPHSRPHPHQ